MLCNLAAVGGVAAFAGMGSGTERGGDVRWAEELLQHDVHPAHHLGQQEILARLVERRLFALVPALDPWETEAGGGRAGGRGGERGG